MLRRGVLVVALVAVLPVVAATTKARACSCGTTTDLKTSVARAQGAFVGAFKGRDDPGRVGDSSLRTVVNHFDVEKAVKGDIGRTIDVDAAAEGASCGLEVAPGQRIGLFVERRGARWTSSLCSQVDPDALLAAAAPAPRAVPRTPSFTG